MYQCIDKHQSRNISLDVTSHEGELINSFALMYYINVYTLVYIKHNIINAFTSDIV